MAESNFVCPNKTYVTQWFITSMTDSNGNVHVSNISAQCSDLTLTDSIHMPDACPQGSYNDAVSVQSDSNPPAWYDYSAPASCQAARAARTVQPRSTCCRSMSASAQSCMAAGSGHRLAPAPHLPACIVTTDDGTRWEVTLTGVKTRAPKQLGPNNPQASCSHAPSSSPQRAADKAGCRAGGTCSSRQTACWTAS